MEATRDEQPPPGAPNSGRVSLRLFFTHCCSCLMFLPQSNRTPLHSTRSHPLSVSTWGVELYFCGPFFHHPKPITRTRYLWSSAVFLCSIPPSPHLRLRKTGETTSKNTTAGRDEGCTTAGGVVRWKANIF